MPRRTARDGQHWSQFLSSALSQRGPDALPYAEDVKWLIRQHLLSLTEAFSTLPIKASQFIHNDGRSSHLLHAEGIVPIIYAGVVYNIPAAIWLLESYPRAPPSVFLTPTRNMVIKPGHPHVDGSGYVSVPYLRNWVYPSSNLVDLVRNLSHFFGQDPPLYTRETPNSGSRVDPSPPSPSPSQSSPQRPSPSRGDPPVASCGSGGRLSQSPQYRQEDRVERRNAISKIVDMAHGDIASVRKSRHMEMEGLFSAQAMLRRREEELSKGLREMQEEKEKLEQQLQVVTLNVDVLDGWVRENVCRTKRGVADADGLFETCDPLSMQQLECSAADLAVEDTIDALDRAALGGIIPFDAYLKNVRALSREQFFQRATLVKVRVAQTQAQIKKMAARAPQYAT